MNANADAGKIAVVTPWFGPELVGGAERLAWQTAHGLAQRGRAVDVLTTCSRSFPDDWGCNHYAPGAERNGSLTIRRFLVDPRDGEAFERANALLLATSPAHLRPGRAPASPQTCEAFFTHNIRSRELTEHLVQAGEAYSSVIFLPYLYGTTLDALGAVKERAFLHPLLHDEPYAYLPRVEACIHDARGLIFLSEGEFLLAKRLYGPGIVKKSRIVGNWIDPPRVRYDSASARGPLRTSLDPMRDRYVLYMGRREETKNLGMLVEAHREYRAHHHASDLKLVLIGPGATSFADPTNDVVDLGHVDDKLKHLLLSKTLALFQPSYNESYSRAMMEAWSHGRPVVVHEHCLSTALPVTHCEGGWVAATKRDWTQALQTIDAASPETLASIGGRGRRHYETHSTPERVLERYEAALRLPSTPHFTERLDACDDRMRVQLAAQKILRNANDPSLWDIVPDRATIERLKNTKSLIVSVGAITPNSGHRETITAFSYLLAMQCDAHLAFVHADPISEHASDLAAFIEQQGLSARIHISTGTAREEMAAYYLSASLLCVLSEEQSPLCSFVDAMWFDMPILALSSAPARELLGSAGMLVTTREEAAKLGALMKLLLRDDDLRAKVLAAQHARRRALDHEPLERLLDADPAPIRRTA
jgi:glycosyltransferase involved in cell wall biosynthesis